MIYHNYKILEIKEICHSTYGTCIMVLANPVKLKDKTFEFSTIIDKRTIKFLFPFRYLQELLRIANTSEYWSPSDDWYIKERIYDHKINMYGPIYVHMNLDLDMINGVDIDDDIPILNDASATSKKSIIPNIEFKFMKIIEDWEKEIEKPETDYGYNKEGGPGVFLECEYSEKNGFFSWLFDDDKINVSFSSELTEEQEEAYDNFLMELDKEGLSPIK